METKGEKREKIRENNRKMVVRGRSIFTIVRAKIKRMGSSVTGNTHRSGR